MATKQAARSKQKKALKRKKQLAVRGAPQVSGGIELLGHDPIDDPLALVGIKADDYLPNGLVKASAALLAMARPVMARDGITRRDAVQKLLVVALAAWNMEVAEGKGRPIDGLLEDLEALVPADTHETLREMIAYFRDAKRALFPDDERMLVDVEVVGTDDRWRVNVASASVGPARA